MVQPNYVETKAKFFDMVENVSDLTQPRERPHKVVVIINNEQVVFVARNTNNWRGC
jgi:hypothetical protein